MAILLGALVSSAIVALLDRDLGVAGVPKQDLVEAEATAVPQ